VASQIWCDSAGAISFKDDTCPVSKIRGSFDYREDWVEDLKESGIVEVDKVKEARNMADIFTKAYPTYKFKERKKLILDANFFNAG
jgi:hypothetical protein